MPPTSLKIFSGTSRMDTRRAQLADPPVDAVATGIWEPEPRDDDRPTTSDILNRRAALPPLPVDIEAELVSILVRPIAADQTHERGATAREHALGEQLARLDAVQALQLGRRLDAMRCDDALAQAFLRLTVDRRTRLRAFLADVRRRRGCTR